MKFLQISATEFINVSQIERFTYKEAKEEQERPPFGIGEPATKTKPAELTVHYRALGSNNLSSKVFKGDEAENVFRDLNL